MVLAQKLHFWIKNRRLRQAASRRKMVLVKNFIFDQKKAPAASRQPRKMVFFPENVVLGQKKGACGKPPAEEKKFWKKRPKHFFDRFFGPKSYRHGRVWKNGSWRIKCLSLPKKAPAATRQPRKIVKNTKIGLKWVAVGAFGTSPIPTCTVFRAWFAHYRQI